MDILLGKLLPILGYFAAGLIAQHLNLVGPEKGSLLVRLSFFYTLPALVFHSITHTQLSLNIVYLPTAAVLVIALVTLTAWLYTRIVEMPPRDKGTIILGSMSMNAAFAIPFVLVFFGTEAMAYAILFDLGNALVVFTACYFVAFHFGDNALPARAVMLRIAKSPLLHVVTLAIICSLQEWRLPPPYANAMLSFGSLTGPLLLVGMGILFTPKRQHVKPASLIIGLRMLGGLAAMLLLMPFLNIEDPAIMAGMVMVAAAPMGMTSLSYGVISGLDTKLLASAISISILIGLFWVPLLAWFYL
jgi:malate permease and related proteins